jgi:hypothetical protein
MERSGPGEARDHNRPDVDADLETTTADGTNWATVCLNCDAPLRGAFCSRCGQRALPPHPTTKELAGDAYSELVGWDGKVAKTIRLLLRHPGELTRRLLNGQRSRYISPVRLYLICSLLYFLVVAAAPLPDVGTFDVSVGVGASSAETRTPGEQAFAKSTTEGFARLTAAEKADLEKWTLEQPRFFQPILRAAARDYTALQKRVTATMPRALFLLVPLLALILGVFYRGRHFPEHLYFAIHFQAFVFIVLTLIGLATYSRLVIAIAIAQTLGALVILAYGIVAQRRVYGGRWLATAVKAIGVALVYLFAWTTTTLIVTVFLASR